jgi:hypothetical protein
VSWVWRAEVQPNSVGDKLAMTGAIVDGIVNISGIGHDCYEVIVWELLFDLEGLTWGRNRGFFISHNLGRGYLAEDTSIY